MVTHDAVYAFQISLAFGYIFLALGIFLWLQRLFPWKISALSAVISMYVPYLFVDMYVRGSIGEIWAIALVFWILFFIEKRFFPLLALFTGLLILSHNIMAMLFSPFILFYSMMRCPRMVWFYILGVFSASFFWLPALLEQKFVVGLNTVNFREHFVQLYELLIPSWGTQFSSTGALGSKISFQIGLGPLLTIIGSVFIIRKYPQRDIRSVYILCFSFLVVGLLLIFPVTEPIWSFIAPLQFVQYPWRLLSYSIPITAIASAIFLSSIRTPFIRLCVMFFAVMVAFSYSRPVTYEPRNEAYYMARRNFTDGTSSMGNSFSTIWSPWKKERFEKRFVVSGGNINAMISDSYLKKEIRVDMNRDGEVVANIYYFPGWSAYIDTKKVTKSIEQEGVLAIPVPKGSHEVQFIFEQTPVRVVSFVLSMLSLLSIFSQYPISRLVKKGSNTV